MSNKAIVFYTGELLEVQENSLRETHGVENITLTSAQVVPANQFWSPGNRRVAEEKQVI